MKLVRNSLTSYQSPSDASELADIQDEDRQEATHRHIDRSDDEKILRTAVGIFD